MNRSARTVTSERGPASRKGDRFPSLDGIRAVSVAIVMADHLMLSRHYQHIWVDGFLGVRSFFVLSGFLITHLLITEERATGEISLKLFYLRRALRIFPVYLAFIAALEILTLITPLWMNGCQLVTSLTYTKNFGCGQWIDGHLWSLSVEEQFYLIWPLVLVTTSTRARVIFACALMVIGPLSRVLLYKLGATGPRLFWPLTNFDILMFGCVAAIIMTSYPDRLAAALRYRRFALRLLAAISIVLVIFLEKTFRAGWFTVPFGPSVEAAALAYLIVSYASAPIGPVGWLLNTRAFVLVGTLSYSFYIWQQPFFSTPDVFGGKPYFFLSIPNNVILLVCVAVLSYYGLERPLLRLRRYLRLRPAAGSNAEAWPSPAKIRRWTR